MAICGICGESILIPGLDAHLCPNCGWVSWEALKPFENGIIDRTDRDAKPIMRFGYPEQVGEFAGYWMAVGKEFFPVYKLPDGSQALSYGQRTGKGGKNARR